MASRMFSPTFFAILFSLTCGFSIPCTAPCAPSMAGDRAELEKVLDQWAHALGGRERLIATQSLQTLSKVKMFGLEGTLEEWFTSEGEHRQDLDLAGIIKVTVVRTAGHCWLLDQSGTISEQAGKDLEDEIRDVFLGTWSHLLPARMAGRMELLEASPGTAELRIRILPEGGTPVIVSLDPRTHLPVRSESTDESGDPLITVCSNWRDFDGILFPARIVQTTGTPEDERVIGLTAVRLNEPPPPGAFGRPQREARDVRFAAGREATDIPLDIQGVHPLLQVSVNDSSPLWFLLDSGASITLINKDVAGNLGFELAGRAVGDGVGEAKFDVRFVRNVALRTGGAELPAQTMAAVDLRLIEAGLGREIDGILGYDFISQFVVEIDYLNRKLHLYEREGWDYQGSGAEVPIWFLNNKPVCHGTITMPGGHAIDCTLRFDTGSGGSITLYSPFTAEHDLLSMLPAKFEDTGGRGLGGTTRAYVGRIGAVKVGGLEFKAPTCSFSRDKKGISADTTHAGKLGGRILERCTVILDYERNRIFLEPNTRFGVPFPGPMSGLSIATGGRGDWHTFTVSDVIKGSPASEAGFKAGDAIVSVDGQPASEFWLQDLASMFREEGREIRIGIRRDGKTLLRKLRMRPML